jgi:hypothetical protein
VIEAHRLAAILDSLLYPPQLADTNHMTIYMNRAAIEYYDGGESLMAVRCCLAITSNRKDDGRYPDRDARRGGRATDHR